MIRTRKTHGTHTHTHTHLEKRRCVFGMADVCADTHATVRIDVLGVHECLNLLLDSRGNVELFLIVTVDYGSVLRAAVVSLSVFGRGVMYHEKELHHGFEIRCSSSE